MLKKNIFPTNFYLLIVIYEAFCFDVAQGRMNGAANEMELSCEGLLV